MLNHLFITSDVAALISDFVAMQLQQHGAGAATQPIQALLDDIPTHRHLSFEQWWQLLERLAALFPQPALGLQIGASVKVEHFGCLGYLLKTSKNLEQALRCFERFQRLLYDGNFATLSIQAGHDQASLATLNWQADYGYSSQLSDELLLSALMQLSRMMLATPELRPFLLVEFTNQVSEHLKPEYEHFFGCEVRFGCANLAVTFPASFLSTPIPGSDAHLHQLMNLQAENLLEHAPEVLQPVTRSPFVTELHRVLVRALQEGEPSAEAVARHFHLSTRSLHRRLQEEGLVFRDFLRDVRMTLAQRYLKDDKMSLPEISLMLGYSEQSAFSRAFKQWFGQTPLKYQKCA